MTVKAIENGAIVRRTLGQITIVSNLLETGFEGHVPFMGGGLLHFRAVPLVAVPPANARVEQALALPDPAWQCSGVQGSSHLAIQDSQPSSSAGPAASDSEASAPALQLVPYGVTPWPAMSVRDGALPHMDPPPLPPGSKTWDLEPMTGPPAPPIRHAEDEVTTVPPPPPRDDRAPPPPPRNFKAPPVNVVAQQKAGQQQRDAVPVKPPPPGFSQPSPAVPAVRPPPLPSVLVPPSGPCRPPPPNQQQPSNQRAQLTVKAPPPIMTPPAKPNPPIFQEPAASSSSSSSSGVPVLSEQFSNLLGVGSSTLFSIDPTILSVNPYTVLSVMAANP